MSEGAMELLELIARNQPCRRVPTPDGRSPAEVHAFMSELYQAGWINVSHYIGDGSVPSGQLLMLTDAGATALERAQRSQDVDATDGSGLTVEEKRVRRTDFMEQLYGQTDGNTGLIVDSLAVGQALGWTPASTKPVVRYLADRGLVAYRALGGKIAITPDGVEEVESAMLPTADGTDNLASIHVEAGDVSGVIQVVHGDGSPPTSTGHPPPPPPPSLRSRIGGWTWTLILGIAGSLIATAIIWLATHRGEDDAQQRTPGTLPSATTSSTATGLEGEIVELAGNRNGSPVFAGPDGSPVAGSTPTRIPYGTAVSVECKADNQSGMASVSGFYLIASGPWQGLYVVADTMTNGGSLGDASSPNVDPRVPPC